VPLRGLARAITTLGIVGAVAATMIAAAPSSSAADTVEATQCHTASLPRQRTEVSADISVPQFDPSLGTLLEVTVPTQSVHLDTDAAFENTAQSAVTFAEHMDYVATFTSPGGLASPAPLTGTIERVPSQTLAAFDGTLDYAGPSAVTQPATGRDAAASAVGASDVSALASFTGTGTMPFHVATMITEVFNGGGGNVQAEINTFVAATVSVCYRYAVPVEVPPEVTRTAAPPVPVPAQPRTTG
jgi:hypothetical protein